jgi:alpha-glucuronidase
MPLDGMFDGNVVLQIKNGPYDFQVREPVSPLLGVMEHTAQALEFQLTQEYTGHQIDVYYQPPMWREVLDFNTGAGTLADFAGNRIQALTAVSNVGSDENWTGNALAAANLYAFGRVGWDPRSAPESIAGDWCALTLGDMPANETVKKILLNSRSVYERYTTPLGLGWFVRPYGHYGPDPMGYEFSKWGTYHRADHAAVGIDRSTRGTGYTAQYEESIAARYNEIDTCPEELLLFFHRVRYGHVLKNGKTLLQHLYDEHFKGAEEAAAAYEAWRALEECVPSVIFDNVLERMALQVENAEEWRDIFNTFFYRLSGIGDGLNRRIYA